ncbi:MAG: glycosyltransferase family 4 protein, partial [Phycisphaerae bacterium]|nr:glycosyltransferase family 4 protein [Phycisphaerae bacterium]
MHANVNTRHPDETVQGTQVQRIAMIGNYLPRQCGIATFTTDLCDALAREYAGLQCLVLAMNDTETGYQYPPAVRFEITEQDPKAYLRAASFLELGNVDLVCLQHEFGIFGGEAGAHILTLLRELRMPIVTTLHTVFQEAQTPQYAEVFEEIIQLSDRVVVLTSRGVEILRDVHKVPRESIDLIPHGIHDTPFVDPNFYKDRFGVEGKSVILTSGLLGPNKGIEYVLNALPRIIKAHPDVAYIVLGATHPNLVRRDGERYRESLMTIVQELRIEDHVIFDNRFVGIEELLEYIGAADIYVTPYPEREQISSGALAYALGAGKAIVSTSYWYAEELLGDGRGRLVPFKDPSAIADQVNDLLSNPAELHAIRKRAYLHGREMIWAKVARQYMRSFLRAREERMRQPRAAFRATASLRRPIGLPAVKLDHIRRLTDDTGMIQHAVFAIPSYDTGYTTDDNARALVLAVLLEGLEKEAGDLATRHLAETYLAFLWHAFNKATGRFRNQMSYDRRFTEEIGSEDSHGRAVWALGAAAGRSRDVQLRTAAAQLFGMALPAVAETTSPRCWAFALLGIHDYMRRFYGDHTARTARQSLATKLMDMYRSESSQEWPWFEHVVTYANARLPHALLVSGRWIPSGEMVEAGLEALRWLAEIQQGEGGCFSPIGNQGF